MHVSTFVRTSMTVADLGRAEAFYRDAFGFERGEEFVFDDPAWMRLLGLPPQGHVRKLIMRLGAQQILLSTYDPPGRPYPEARAANDPWFHHIAIVVDDIEGAYARLQQCGVEPISKGGPQCLPANTGGVTALKFRDPDGHPLELLHFPPAVGDAVWHQDVHRDPRGYDHSAIVVTDVERSIAFYTGLLGLKVAGRSLNQGEEQDRLDGLTGCVVDVVGLAPIERPTPHVELLRYRQPPGRAPITDIAANDIVCTRLAFEVDDLDKVVGRLRDAGTAFVSPGIVSLKTGNQGATIRDPDGHMIVLVR